MGTPLTGVLGSSSDFGDRAKGDGSPGEAEGTSAPPSRVARDKSIPREGKRGKPPSPGAGGITLSLRGEVGESGAGAEGCLMRMSGTISSFLRILLGLEAAEAERGVDAGTEADLSEDEGTLTFFGRAVGPPLPLGE